MTETEIKTDGKMLEALVCPLTGGSLALSPEKNELISKRANLAFPIRNGIPVLLETEARTLS